MSEDEQVKQGPTIRKIVRWAGSIAIVSALSMALLAAYVIDTRSSPTFFIIYWTIFFVFIMSALGLAVLDSLMTLIKFRKEHAKLRKDFSKEFHGNKKDIP